MAKRKKKRWALIHVNGCGKVAAMFKREPAFMETINAENCVAISKDKAKPEPGDIMTCGSCGEVLTNGDLCVEYIIGGGT